jgi:hypothetical protein
MTDQHDTIEHISRQQIAEFLPQAIEQALTSYHRFSQQPVPEEAKEFSAHHSACKVAIAHIDLLIKLAKWADMDTQSSTKSQELDRLMQQAMQEIAEYEDT